MRKSLVVFVSLLSIGVGLVAWSAEPINRAKASNLSVSITEPGNHRVFGVGDIVVVKVLPQGDSANLPYRLVVRSNGNITQTFEILSEVWLEVEQEFAFCLVLPGSGAFTAYLEGADQAFAFAECSYSVVTEVLPPQVSSLQIPWFTDGP